MNEDADSAEDAYERMFELAVVLGDAMDGGLRERGLTRSRAELLWRLHHGGPATQRQLSDALRCTPRNVTGLLDSLEGDGLVARSPHPTDRRATMVTLTDAGATALTQLHDAHGQGARDVFAGVSPDDLSAFVRILDHVLARTRARGEGGGS